MRTWRWLLALLALGTLSGCFDLLQELWINPDGTARMVMDFALPKSLLHLAGQDPLTKMREDAKATEAELKKDPAVTKFSFRDFEEGDQHHLVYELEVNDATRLPELQRRAMQRANESGQNQQKLELAFDLKRTAAGNLLFSQTLGGDGAVTDGGTAAAKDAADAFAQQMVGAMFAGHYLTVRIHAPGFGATNGTLNEKKDAVEWKIPVAELAQDKGAGRALHAEIHTAAPLWVWAVVLGVPAFLLMLVVGMMKRRKQTAAA